MTRRHDDESTPQLIETNHCSRRGGYESAYRTAHESSNIAIDEVSAERSSASLNDGQPGTNGTKEQGGTKEDDKTTEEDDADEDDTKDTDQPLSADSIDDEVRLRVSKLATESVKLHKSVVKALEAVGTCENGRRTRAERTCSPCTKKVSQFYHRMTLQSAVIGR